jgi:hypothetical protein
MVIQLALRIDFRKGNGEMMSAPGRGINNFKKLKMYLYGTKE